MDAKKKKNKKKKGNQQKGTEDATSNSEKVTMQESNNEPVLEENHNTDNSTISEIHSVGVSESDMEHDRHKINEESVAKLQGQVEKLENKRTLLVQKQVDLEEKIKFLQKEVGSCVQKGATLEGKICHFEIENGRLIQREVCESDLEEKLKNVEKIKEGLILTVNSLKERITVVEEARIALDMQVKELEGQRNTYFEVNQLLMEKMVGLELRIQSLEERPTSCENLTEKMTEFPEDTIPGKHAEAPSTLSGNQTSESAEVSMKVNEPYLSPAEHVQQSSATELNQAKTLDTTSSPSHYVSESSEKTTEPGQGVQEKLVANSGINDSFSETIKRSGPQPVDGRRLGEGVSVPFDEIEIHEDGSTDVPVQMHVHVAGPGPEPVPFSDAPLIGAPFRLISFMAKFVSGADLVEHNSNSGSDH